MLKTEKEKAPDWPHGTRKQSHQVKTEYKRVSSQKSLPENKVQSSGLVTAPHRSYKISDIWGCLILSRKTKDKENQEGIYKH